jgi:hypothetical protein
MYKVYVDQDGVLSDFNKEFEKLGHGSPEAFSEKHGDEAMWYLINNKTDHFWLDMEWIPDGKKFWNFIKKFNPTILTKLSPVTNCKKDKIEWLKKNLGDIPIIPTTKKEKYASPDAVLIDDMEENIEKWVEVGGIGILYKSAEQAILEFKKLMKQASFHYANIDELLKEAPLYNQDADTIINTFESRSIEDKRNLDAHKILSDLSYMRDVLDKQLSEQSNDIEYREDIGIAHKTNSLQIVRDTIVNMETQIEQGNFEIKPLIKKFKTYLNQNKSNPFWYTGLTWIDEVERDLEKLK